MAHITKAVRSMLRKLFRSVFFFVGSKSIDKRKKAVI